MWIYLLWYLTPFSMLKVKVSWIHTIDRWLSMLTKLTISSQSIIGKFALHHFIVICDLLSNNECTSTNKFPNKLTVFSTHIEFHNHLHNTSSAWIGTKLKNMIALYHGECTTIDMPQNQDVITSVPVTVSLLCVIAGFAYQVVFKKCNKKNSTILTNILVNWQMIGTLILIKYVVSSWINFDKSLLIMIMLSILINRVLARAPFYWYGFTVIPTRISNPMLSKEWYKITYLFPTFNSCTIEVSKC